MRILGTCDVLGKGAANSRRGVIDEQCQGAPRVLPLRLRNVTIKIGTHKLAGPLCQHCGGRSRQPS
jgi:hypothetical protein